MSKKMWVGGVAVWILLLFSGCDETRHTSKTKESTISSSSFSPTRIHHESDPQGQKSPPLPESASSSQETKLMRNLGLQITDGRIILDTEKSKIFFESLEKKLREGMREGIQKAKERTPRESDPGIYIRNDRIEIDVNKTKSFMRDWIETMEIIGKEINRSLRSLDP